jgi:hypothetical protein
MLGRPFQVPVSSPRLTLSACLMAMLTVLAQGCASRAAEDDAELLLRAVPENLSMGEAGSLEVRVVAKRALGTARLQALNADGGLAIEPAEHRIEDLKAPRAFGGMVVSPPNPPALGLVPVRVFRLTPIRPGTHEITVELTAGDSKVADSIKIGVKQ